MSVLYRTQMPSPAGTTEWLNSAPLGPAEPGGQVAVIDARAPRLRAHQLDRVHGSRHSFVVIECTIPDGVTIEQWRRSSVAGSGQPYPASRVGRLRDRVRRHRATASRAGR